MEKTTSVQIPERYRYQRVEQTGKEVKIIFVQEDAACENGAITCIKVDDLSAKDFKNWDPTTAWQKTGKQRILEALKHKPRSGCIYTTTYEVSEVDGEMQSVAGAMPLVGKSCNEAKTLAKQFDQARDSRLGTLHEYFLIIARLLKDQVITPEQAFDNSRTVGNYWNNPNSAQKMQKTGTYWNGPLAGFIGNTYKILADDQSDTGFSLVGGSYYGSGDKCPAGDVCHVDFPNYALYSSVLWVVLEK